MAPYKILALHGFLGRGSDWNFLKDDSSFKGQSVDFFTPHLFSESPSGHSLRQEAALLYQKWEPQMGEAPILMGYSYGGRLAVEMALAHPQKFSKLILISCGYGWANPEKRNERYENDERWAQDFLNLEWSALLDKWNGLEILGAPANGAAQGQPGLRLEADFNRRRLAETLRLRSPAQMAFNLARLGEIAIPVLLLAGEADTAYAAAAKEAAGQFSHAQLEIFANTSHRLPWQQKDRFCQRIHQFIFS